MVRPTFTPCFCRFCTKHGNHKAAVQSAPAELTSIAKMVIPKLIIRLVHYLRAKFPGMKFVVIVKVIRCFSSSGPPPRLA